MDDILFLAQRCPYPPNKGDRITTWNILDYLRRSHRVHLGVFIDDPADLRHEAHLRQCFDSVHLVPISRPIGLARSLRGLASGDALSVAYYRDASMQAWVHDRVSAGVSKIFVYSGAMARFALDLGHALRLMHFADIDSDKWRQYASVSRWPMSWIYRREARLLLQWERRVAAAFDVSFFVSEAETADFRRMAPESAHKITALPNGVDSGYFDPSRAYDDPYPDDVPRLVFTGAMDYRPNVDAVVWFCREVLPRLRKEIGAARFAIVGSKPSAEVRALATDPMVTVTGRVEDVRPWIAHAGVVVAPLRIARGIQNKVLEGMAMGKTVVCSPQGLEGIDAEPGRHLLVADGADEQALLCVQVLRGAVDLGAAARSCMLARFDWNACLSKLDPLLAPSPRAIRSRA